MIADGVDLFYFPIRIFQPNMLPGIDGHEVFSTLEVDLPNQIAVDVDESPEVKLLERKFRIEIVDDFLHRLVVGRCGFESSDIARAETVELLTIEHDHVAFDDDHRTVELTE